MFNDEDEGLRAWSIEQAIKLSGSGYTGATPSSTNAEAVVKEAKKIFDFVKNEGADNAESQ